MWTTIGTSSINPTPPLLGKQLANTTRTPKWTLMSLVVQNVALSKLVLHYHTLRVIIVAFDKNFCFFDLRLQVWN